MSSSIEANATEQSITINDLSVKNAEFFGLVSSEPEETQIQTVLDIIAVGSAAMQRVRTTIDLDFVESRFGTLSGVFEKSLTQLEKRATDALSQRFSPTESGSYTKQLGDLLSDAKRDVQRWNQELTANANALLDPEKKSSGISKLGELIQQASSRFEQMFNPDLRSSYAFRLHHQLSQVFGMDGQVGILQETLQNALKPVFAELQEVKGKLEAKKAAEQIIESSSLKGKPFEEWVQTELSRLALQHGDDVQWIASGSNGSRAGDFLVTFAGIGKSAVVEARNRKQMSLPAIKADLDRELVERAADLAIYVSSGTEMLPQHVGEFQIYGNKVVTTADNLHIAYRLSRVLAGIEAPDGTVDVAGVRTVLSKIKDAARALRDIKSKATQVKKIAEGINTDADGTEVTIIALIAEAERLLESTVLAETA
ncbi:MAG TPA: hypothetical protein VKW06_19395 [Candidatus Angelobacter sp.]|nr:hypothetical protein [Candidatus Angelobacter sp.]